jgi:hypothetical protein
MRGYLCSFWARHVASQKTKAQAEASGSPAGGFARASGVRFKKSFESENNWYKINEYGARQLILWSIPLAIIGVVTFFLPLKENGIVTIVVAFAPLILVIPAITSWLYTKKI